ncbi:CU044_5270 family protein, partial [Streptomyces tendae]
MADELDLLRIANPVPADAPQHADGPLDHRGERHLHRLLHEPPPARASRWRPTGGRSAHRGVRLAWGLAATAVVAVTALTLLLGGPSA